ncbi:MAG TPA: 2-hydroxyacyl-CoA dehydratase [Spirochaetes bacterium]|nr:2-hydroxyacyl-CoA dehydratase [Spirochaetota bacterium]
MNPAIAEAAAVHENSFVRRWKQEGKTVVGYTCSYVPEEMLHAADILPFRLRGTGARETTVGDTYFGPYICSLPKCVLQLAGEGAFGFLDGAVIVPGCDSMRRLDECWRKAGEDIAGIVPPFFFHLAVPHKYDGYTVSWFAGEITRLREALEGHFRREISDEKISDSIKLYNEGRRLLERLDEMRVAPDAPLTGSEALTAVLAGTAMPRADYNRLLAGFIEEKKNAGAGHAGRIRLMVVGSACDDVGLLELIEGDRALVVGDNLCFGSRFHRDLVDEDGDPVAALARRYLARNECPRMYGGYRDRLGALAETVRRANIEGVILQNIRFCDLHGAENGLFERALEAMGVPCLRLEREYGPLVETGRLRMRLDALLERINRKREKP